jgi:hypothetical protein
MKQLCRWGGLVAVCLAGAPALAGPVNSYAFNRVTVFTDALTQIIGSTTSLTHEPPAVIGVVDLPDLAQSYSASSSILPFSGDAKDGAHGTASATVLLGSGDTPDRFSFSFSGTASAVNAYAAAGDPASAFVDLNATIGFYIDAIGPAGPAGSFLGNLEIGPVRAATAYETITVQVSSLGHGVIRRLVAGSAATSVPILSGDRYTIDLSYQMLVPHGVDPDFSVLLGASVGAPAPVPEPMAYVLLPAGLAAVIVARRRKRAGR